mgnify:CR=1 FL=1
MNPLLTEEMLHQKTSQELTALLYEAAINNMEEAIEAIQQKAYMQANIHLQKTNDILHRLGAGLNYEAGIIADQLEALYEYMAERIIIANARKDIAIIEEVLRMMKEIAQAWQQAMQTKTDKQTAILKQSARVYEQNSIYEK